MYSFSSLGFLETKYNKLLFIPKLTKVSASDEYTINSLY